MPGTNLIQAAGGAPQKQTRFVSLFTSRFMVGIYTNRNPLRGPLSAIYSDYYHVGTTDALIDGLNTELTARLTMARRTGNPKYSTQNTLAAIDTFFAFHHSDGTIETIGDSLTDIETFTTTTLSSLFTKAAGAGQGFYEDLNGILYEVDGVDFIKYIPGVINSITGKPIFNFGGAAPTVPPTLNVVAAGSISTLWQASTLFSTMGVIVDTNNNIQQLQAVVNGINVGSGVIGETSPGAPGWNQTAGGTTNDNGVTWRNLGQIAVWQANTNYITETAAFSTTGICCVYSNISKAVYVNISSASPSNSGLIDPGVFTSTPGVSVDAFSGGARMFCLGKLSAMPNGYCLGNWVAGKAVQAVPNQTRVIEPFVTPGGVTPVYLQETTNSGTTGGGPGTIPWGTAVGQTVLEPTAANASQLQWVCVSTNKTWASATSYTAWISPTNFGFSVVVDGNGCFQICLTTGTSGGSDPFAIWYWQSTHAYSNGAMIVDTNGNRQQISTAGNSGTTAPTWSKVQGATTNDSNGGGTAVWKCLGSAYGLVTTETTGTGLRWVNVGLSTSWAANTKWYLPNVGWSAPSTSNPFGSAEIFDTTNNEFVVNSGVSGGSAPVWNTSSTPGSNQTADNAATWYNAGAPTSNSFTWSSGHGYVFSFKARKTSDIYNTTAPPLWPQPLGAPTGAQDGSITTASPVAQTIGSNSGAQVQISGPGSTDPQFDTVIIFRSADGFGASGPYLFLTEIPMPAIVNGVAGTWYVTDFMPDKATNTLPGLDPLQVAPIGHANDPPPGAFGSLQFVAVVAGSQTAAAGTGLKGLTYHQGRLWGFLGNNVFCSALAGETLGNNFSAWPPNNVFPFKSNVTKLRSTTSGLIVYTTSDLGFIGGGPKLSSYLPQVLVPGIGLLSPNAECLVTGLPHLFAADRQLISVDPSGGITRIGHPIGDKLVAFNPSSVYLTYHSHGDLDHALFISDGSTQWYRCDLNMSPDGQITGPVWSPRATIAGGFLAMVSIETTPGNHTMLIGPSSAGPILGRDSTFTTFSDNGSAYSSFFTIGSMVLAHPGQMAELAFTEMDFMNIGTQPSVSVIFDEISATGGVVFESISNSFVSDPPKKYGPVATPVTIFADRYYFSQTTPGNGGTQVPAPAWCRSMQIKVDFGNTDTVQNELISFTVFGALWAEK